LSLEEKLKDYGWTGVCMLVLWNKYIQDVFYFSPVKYSLPWLSHFLNDFAYYITYGNVILHFEQIICYVYNHSNTDPH
jgi:hypothetical protein